MKTRIFAGIILSGALAASVAQAGTNPPIESVEALYSGLSVAAVQRVHQAAEGQVAARKSTCTWHEVEKASIDPMFTAYPGGEDNFGEKDYLASANQNFVC